MSNMGDVNKKVLTVRVPLEIIAKIEKLRQRMMHNTISDTVVMLLEEGTRNIGLTSADYDAIAKEVRANELKRRNH